MQGSRNAWNTWPITHGLRSVGCLTVPLDSPAYQHCWHRRERSANLNPPLRVRVQSGQPFKTYSGGEARIVSTTPTNTETNAVQPTARFISLSVRAGEVFANREKAMAWLATPNPSLQGRAPIEAANTEEGFEQADEILTRIERGVLG